MEQCLVSHIPPACSCQLQQFVNDVLCGPLSGERVTSSSQKLLDLAVSGDTQTTHVPIGGRSWADAVQGAPGPGGRTCPTCTESGPGDPPAAGQQKKASHGPKRSWDVAFLRAALGTVFLITLFHRDLHRATPNEEN